MAELESLRLDKWLWAARFFKTRQLASEAISGGKVHVNGQRCKPAREIRPGSEISITKDQYHWHITVVALNAQRRPAQEAQLLYEEDPVSREQRQQQIIDDKAQRALLPHSERERRPNKKQRRQIHRFKQI